MGQRRQRSDQRSGGHAGRSARDRRTGKGWFASAAHDHLLRMGRRRRRPPRIDRVGQEHGDELRQHGVVYINSDSDSRGFRDIGGSHTRERLTTQVARDVNDPERNVSVLERRRDREQVLAASPEARKEARERQLIRLDALGSGSDYTPFLQHTGIAAMNVSYGGEGGGGSYHSIYDSFDHYTRFGDPGFQYGIAQAETTGRLVLRLANADVLPIEFTTFADTLSRYLDELTKLAQTTRDDIEERNRLIHERAFEIAADPTKTYVPPKPEPPAP